MSGVVSFLRDKLRTVSFRTLVFSQVEAAAIGFTGWVPGIPGFFIRFVVCKVLFRRLAGMTWIQPGVTFVESNRLSVGSHFGCNSGTYINAIGTISIGDYVLIGSNVTISSGQHGIEGRMPPIFARPTVPKAITIEDDVWIGAGAVIMPGILLRRGTVVGANSVVTRDTQEYAVVVGVPARQIRTRDALR